MPLYDMVMKNTFRQDLVYRINTIEINIPPLRDRTDDIPQLTNHFLKIYSVKYKKEIHKISEAVLSRMAVYGWPGNIRELQHAVERAVIMSNSSVLQPEDFNFNISYAEGDQDNVTIEQYNLDEVEKILIRKVLKKYNGNITQAANELGLTRSSLYRRLEKYAI
jgi:transcriptional regulator with PAS, ATPase and Fis domain